MYFNYDGPTNILISLGRLMKYGIVPLIQIIFIVFLIISIICDVVKMLKKKKPKKNISFRKSIIIKVIYMFLILFLLWLYFSFLSIITGNECDCSGYIDYCICEGYAQFSVAFIVFKNLCYPVLCLVMVIVNYILTFNLYVDYDKKSKRQKKRRIWSIIIIFSIPIIVSIITSLIVHITS